MERLAAAPWAAHRLLPLADEDQRAAHYQLLPPGARMRMGVLDGPRAGSKYHFFLAKHATVQNDAFMLSCFTVQYTCFFSIIP